MFSLKNFFGVLVESGQFMEFRVELLSKVDSYEIPSGIIVEKNQFMEFRVESLSKLVSLWNFL